MGVVRTGQVCATGVLLALTAAACSSSPASAPTPAASPTAAAGAPAPSATASATAPTATGASVGADPAVSPTAAGPALSRLIPAPDRSIRTDGVTVVRTGGFAGLTDTVTVRPDGAWQRSDKRGPVDDGRLTAAQQSALRKLLADPRLAAEARRPAGDGGRCRDAFTYLVVTPRGLVRHTPCPGEGRTPEVAMRIVALLLGATGA
jgi:hypothetical protein